MIQVCGDHEAMEGMLTPTSFWTEMLLGTAILLRKSDTHLRCSSKNRKPSTLSRPVLSVETSLRNPREVCGDGQDPSPSPRKPRMLLQGPHGLESTYHLRMVGLLLHFFYF
jgi:hypothetical protein